ncbi:MAG: TRAP transporter small permease [Desulfobacterales bacterium]|nr:TRAP transporter small permease [Desulfobacterales bacterium]
MQQQTVGKTDGSRLYSVVLFISRAMAVLACSILALMMLFVTADVAGRDFFNRPVRGTVEIVGLLLIVASTWGLGLCQVEKKHLRVTLLYDMFPRRVQRWLDIFAYGVCLVTAAIVSWQMLLLAIKYVWMPHGNTSEILGLPFVPFMIALAWGFGWFGVVLLMDIYMSLREVEKK